LRAMVVPDAANRVASELESVAQPAAGQG